MTGADDAPISTAGGRRNARRAAMMLLYEHDVTGQSLAPDALVERWQHDHNSPLPEYARGLLDGYAMFADDIDATIEQHLHEWTLARLGAVERSILRIATFELTRGTVPVEVAIDEAIELARRYSSEEASRLVNGVLGAIADARQGT